MSHLIALLFGLILGGVILRLFYLARSEYPRQRPAISRPAEVICLVGDLALLGWVGWFFFNLGGAS